RGTASMRYLGAATSVLGEGTLRPSLQTAGRCVGRDRRVIVLQAKPLDAPGGSTRPPAKMSRFRYTFRGQDRRADDGGPCQGTLARDLPFGRPPAPTPGRWRTMALIADLCPHCRRITRCNVVERGGIVGGVLLGVPLVLPVSSVSCTCGECGFEFRSEFWDHGRTVSPA